MWQARQRRGDGKPVITKNLSADGVAFFCEELMHLSSLVTLEMRLPGRRQPIVASAEVMYVEEVIKTGEYMIGARFTDLKRHDRDAIARIVEKVNLVSLLEALQVDGASDLHLTVGKPPLRRRHGRVEPVSDVVIEDGLVEAMIYTLLSREQIQTFERTHELDFAFSPTVATRFRVNLHQQKGFVEAAIRRIPTKLRSFAELGLPVEAMQMFCASKSGLVLIAGSTGVGKTTTLSSMVQHINHTQERVVVTIEDPIEYSFESDKSIIKQRELGADTLSYGDALRRVLRQDPDVVCIGELLDAECLLAALRAAETGHLVISTVHAPSTVQAIERLTNLVAPEHGATIRYQLASCLLGILCQQLVPGTRGERVLAAELLMNNAALRNLIREGRYALMENVLQTGRGAGMYTFATSLQQLRDAGMISNDTLTAFRKTG
jgi:twitching motility protein PilT